MSHEAAPAGAPAEGKSEGSVSKTVGFLRHYYTACAVGRSLHWLVRCGALVWTPAPPTHPIQGESMTHSEPSQILLRATVIELSTEGRAPGVFKAQVRVRQLEDTAPPDVDRPCIERNGDVADFGKEPYDWLKASYVWLGPAICCHFPPYWPPSAIRK